MVLKTICILQYGREWPLLLFSFDAFPIEDSVRKIFNSLSNLRKLKRFLKENLFKEKSNIFYDKE
jgi:hypothetical protein